MLNVKDNTYEPSLKEITDYVNFDLFPQCVEHMFATYQALFKIEFSKDTWAKGWNVKFRKAGKSLCVLYPKESYFTILVVVGKKEKTIVESKMPTFSKRMQEVYENTKEGMGQRWIMEDIHEKDAFYEDILTLIKIRRETK